MYIIPMNVTSKGIHGILVDDESRCQHYHTKLDIIANRCSVCRKLYACYQCHDQLEDHPFGPVNPSDPDSVMCGVCGRTFSYNEYHQCCSCPDCGSAFNPRCSLHKDIYANG